MLLLPSLFLSIFLMLYFVLLSDHRYCCCCFSCFWGEGSLSYRGMFSSVAWLSLGVPLLFLAAYMGEDREAGPAVSLGMKWRRKIHSRCSMYFAEWRKKGRGMTPGPRGITDNFPSAGRSSGQSFTFNSLGIPNPGSGDKGERCGCLFLSTAQSLPGSAIG